MEEHKEVFILLKDKEGEKYTNVVVGTLFGNSPCNILRGALAIRIPEKHSKSGPPHNYQTAFSDQPATFCDSIDDSAVAPLLGNQAPLLAGVVSYDERYQLFVKGKLEWGSSLKVNDPVLVSLKHLQPADTGATPRAMGLIHYVGPVKGVNGIRFGIEIVDHRYYGQGTTNGDINGERYFHCNDGNGMFVSFDKLSEIPPGYQVPGPSPPMTRQPQTHVAQTRSKVKSYRFKKGDRVVAFKNDGNPVGGTVRWVGRYLQQTEKKQDFSVSTVGIETDVKIVGTDMESCLPPKHHLFTVGKKKGTLFMREEEVMLEADFLGQPQQENDDPPREPPARPPRPPRSQEQQSHAGHQSRSRWYGEKSSADVGEHRHPTQEEGGQLNVEDQQKFAEQMGAGSHTRLVKEQSELIEKIEKEKQEKDVRQALNIPPDQSLVRGQQRMFDQFKEGSQRNTRPEHPDHIYDTLHDPPNSTGQPAANPPTHHPPPPTTNPLQQPHTTQRPGYPPPEGQYSSQSQVPISQSHQSSYDPHLTSSSGAGGSVGDWSTGRHSNNPPGHNVAYASHPGQPLPPLEVGSPVELIQDHNRHGVIRWKGPLPVIQGTIAGVELDAPMEGCGDGEWNGIRYFTCSPGRGFFCPVTSLRPDGRFSQAEQQLALPSQAGNQPLTNPLKDLGDWEEMDQHMQADQIFKYLGNEKGIQGHQNSCYLDATIFGLFALSDVFDSLFLDQNTAPLQSLAAVDQSLFVQREVGSMLWKGIVNPLRKNGAVKYDSVMSLRNKLEELGKMEKVNTAEKDPEEFLNMLFKHILHVDPFIRIKRPFGTEPEFFVQLFVEFDASIKIPTIDKLMSKMFREQQISFEEVPSKLLVQVPRYGREFQAYKRIIPGIKFDASHLIGSNEEQICFICGDRAVMRCPECGSESAFKPNDVFFCDTCNGLTHKHPDRRAHEPARCVAAAVELELLSVLCIETSHYVCFSRDSEERWIFFDSMADRVYDQYNIPRGVDCTDELKRWVYEGDQERLMSANPRELPELVRRFTQDVYMCVYIQPDYGMYG